MDSKTYREYLKTNHWIGFREKVKRIDGYRCVNCGSVKNLDVHHINYERLYNEDVSDCVTLCRTCHNDITGDLEQIRCLKWLADNYSGSEYFAEECKKKAEMWERMMEQQKWCWMSSRHEQQA